MVPLIYEQYAVHNHLPLFWLGKLYMNVFGKEEKDYGGGLYKKWLSKTKEKEKLRDVNRGEENIINIKNLGHAWLM